MGTLIGRAILKRLTSLRVGDAEFDAAIVVGLDGGGNVQILERNRSLVGIEHVQSVPHDGVIGYLLLVPVAEDHDRKKATASDAHGVFLLDLNRAA